MKYVILTLAILLLSACGREPGTYEGFETYVDRFVKEGAARGVKVDLYGIDIKLVDELPDGVAGGCGLTSGRIKILKSEWSSESNREELLFHELGHCAMYLEHAPCPSIMCRYMIYNEYWKNRSKHLDQLFKR